MRFSARVYVPSELGLAPMSAVIPPWSSVKYSAWLWRRCRIPHGASTTSVAATDAPVSSAARHGRSRRASQTPIDRAVSGNATARIQAASPIATPNASAAVRGRRGASTTSNASAATISAAAGTSVPTTEAIAIPAGHSA